MVSSKILSLSTLTLLPLTSLAAPAPVPEAISVATAAVSWTPVEFEGDTIYVNSAAIIHSSLNPAEQVTKNLRRVPDSNDCCDGTTNDPHPAPFANSADCWAIHDYAASINAYFGVWTKTPDTHAIGLLRRGTCVFEAGTRNIYDTWIGSANVRDIMNLAIRRWNSNDVVAAQGQTQCQNESVNFAWSTVRWTIKHS